ncbi:cleavage polyadenylation factor subunit fip1 [Coemansia erecta]|nr:cleavage polyadenylation factor subunit fip1 [Coemansia erecta]
MSDKIDDEDAFLYGDLEADTITEKKTEQAQSPQDESATDLHFSDTKSEHENENDEDQEEENTRNGEIDKQEDEQRLGESDDEEGDSVQDAEESDADSDSSYDDLEIILEPAGGDGSNQTNGDSTAASAGNAQQGNSGDGLTKDDSGERGIQALFAGGVDRMDILTVPLLQGMDMYTIDIDMLEEKPWRLPGADITDYFNFGFNEETWKLYCMKQKEIRAYYNIHKMLPPGMMMMPGVPAGGMPMANPAMYANMMKQGIRPGMPANMFPQPGVAQPPFMHQGGQAIIPPGEGADRNGGPGGQNGNDRDDSNSGNGSARGPNQMQMTPQQLQFQQQQQQQQQQQMRMGMPPGYFPGPGGPQRNMPMNMQMANLPSQMQMQMQMQMGNRGPMLPPGHGQHGMHQRPPQNPLGHGSGPPMQHRGSVDQRDSDRGSETGRSSRMSSRRDRSNSVQRSRDWNGVRAESRPRHDRERERDNDKERDNVVV